MLVAVDLLICDFSEPIKDSMLQPACIVLISNLIEFLCLGLHIPSLIESLNHLVKVPSLDHSFDLLHSPLIPCTLAK